MWPDYRDAPEQTEQAEWALEQAHHAVLRTWVPEIKDMVLPTLGGEPLPPDLDAPVKAQSMALWAVLLDDWVVPARAMIWCYTFLLACHGMRLNPLNVPLTAAADPVVWLPRNPDFSKITPGPNKPMEENPDIRRGPSASGASENWTSDFPTWLAHFRELQKNWFTEEGDRAAYYREPPKAGPGILEMTADDEWPDFDTGDDEPEPPDLIRGTKYTPGRRNDTVADLVSLAWDTDPGQMKMAAQLIWDDPTNKRKLQRFLSEPNGKRISNTIPGRVRDMLVGSTNKRARQAIPMNLFREELGIWLDQVLVYGPKTPDRPTGGWVSRTRYRTRKDWIKDERYEKGSFQGFYEREYEPKLDKKPAMDFFKRFRDAAHSSGLEAAGIINQATIAAASGSGVDFDLLWVARMDARTRPTHFAADGQRQSIDGMFLVGGADLAYPGDPNGPPEQVVNCRCRVGMVEVGKPTPSEMRRSRAEKTEIAYRKVTGVVRAREDPDGIGYIIPMTWTEEDIRWRREIREQRRKAREAKKARTAAVDEEQENTVDAIIDTQTYRTFTDAVVAFIGVPTSDYRLLVKDIKLSWRSFPLPLMWCRQSKEGHSDSFTVGVIESGRVDGDRVLVSGYLLNTAEAGEAMELLDHRVTRPSIDMSGAEYVMTDEAGAVIPMEQVYDLPEGTKVFQAFTAGELMGVTLVSTPAFGDTALSLNDLPEVRALAAGLGVTYSAALFADPHLDRPTRPVLNPDTGRVYGHLAEFGHTYRGGRGEAVPRNRNGYANFHTSQVMLDDGRQLAVGRLTVKGGHAATAGLSPADVRAHYDNAATAFALVRVGEDSHGIWFSGTAAPGVDPDVLAMGLAAPLSGDWRDCGQGCLDLVAVHAVNSPGFPIYSGATGPDGRDVALVAAIPVGSTRLTITREDVKAVVMEALTEQRFAAERDAALARAEALLGSPRDRIAERLARAGL